MGFYNIRIFEFNVSCYNYGIVIYFILLGEKEMTTLENQLQAVFVSELIKKNDALHKIYPNKLYGQFANAQREKYYKLTGREYHE